MKKNPSILARKTKLSKCFSIEKVSFLAVLCDVFSVSIFSFEKYDIQLGKIQIFKISFSPQKLLMEKIKVNFILERSIQNVCTIHQTIDYVFGLGSEIKEIKDEKLRFPFA